MTLVILFGPPAVGKMTVGMELERLTGLRLFHNHMAIELALRFFSYGSAPFQRLVADVRRRVFEEVAASDLPGLIYTAMWDLDDPASRAYLDEVGTLFRSHGGEVCFVELAAALEERLRRNATELRLAEKPSKRDVRASSERLLAAEHRHRMNSRGDFSFPERHLRIDNTHLAPAEAAMRVVRHFGLPLRHP